MAVLRLMEVERLAQELHALTEVSKALTSPLELHQLLNDVLKRIREVLEPAEAGVIMLWDQSAGLFRPEATYGFDFEIMKELGLRAGESVTGKVYDEGRPSIIRTPEEVASMMADMREANRAIVARSIGTDDTPICMLTAPLSVSGQKFGVLVLETFKGPVVFTEEDLPFLQTIADLIALAIDRARLEAKADSIREARQAKRLRSEVTATLSHQLRMPLSSIKGYTTALLLDEVKWSEEKLKEFLEQIDDECDNMQTLITEILDSSLVEVGQLSIERQPVRLPIMAREIATDIQRRSENHHLIIDFPPDFPLVEVDPRWIKQVFRNIMDNSIKYSPEGGLIVIRGEMRKNDVVVSISDQGVGISPEDLIPLFEKFFRAKSGNGFHVPGTGLGLPIARAIVEAHGGRIWAESQLGQGTTLYFSIPLPKNISDEDV